MGSMASYYRVLNDIASRKEQKEWEELQRDREILRNLVARAWDAQKDGPQAVAKALEAIDYEINHRKEDERRQKEEEHRKERERRQKENTEYMKSPEYAREIKNNVLYSGRGY